MNSSLYIYIYVHEYLQLLTVYHGVLFGSQNTFLDILAHGVEMIQLGWSTHQLTSFIIIIIIPSLLLLVLWGKQVEKKLESLHIIRTYCLGKKLKKTRRMCWIGLIPRDRLARIFPLKMTTLISPLSCEAFSMWNFRSKLKCWFTKARTGDILLFAFSILVWN